MSVSKRTRQRLLTAGAALAILNACNLNPVRVLEPTTVRPPSAPQVVQTSGAIFSETVAYRPLFEDRRARYVGDTLVIQLNEKLAASRNNSTNASRKGEANVSIPIVQGLPGKSFQGAGYYLLGRVVATGAEVRRDELLAVRIEGQGESHGSV